MGRLFGSDGYIVLYSFGGLAVGSNAQSDGWKRGLVSFAGPLAQFLLLGVVVLVLWFGFFPPEQRTLITTQENVYWMFRALLQLSVRNPLLLRFFQAMVFINLFWPLLNLLPIWPLDGGHIAREACVGAFGQRGLRVSLGVSLVVAALLAVNALVALKGEPFIPYIGQLFAGGWFMVLFFAMFAVQSLQMLQAVQAERRWHDDHWRD
jgi:Zn-dependent protease